MYEAKILADSVSPAGVRLVSIQATYPHIVHAHILTHKMLSRSTASSRAIPVAKRIAAIRANPYIPDTFGKNQPGMVATAGLDDVGQGHARSEWGAACYDACEHASNMAELDVHKELANRIAEPYGYTTAIITATEWANFFALRLHPDAQPETQKIARLMHEAMQESMPRKLQAGEWHLPYVYDDERATAGFDWVRVAAGRAARISYLTHLGTRDPSADVLLCDRLIGKGHMSPMEHQATPFDEEEWESIRAIQQYWRENAPMSWSQARIESKCDQMEFTGNLRGFTAFRKMIPGESVFTPPT